MSILHGVGLRAPGNTIMRTGAIHDLELPSRVNETDVSWILAFPNSFECGYFSVRGDGPLRR